jgi:CheY-like chemotaxis protein
VIRLVTGMDAAGRVVVEVRDTGSGVPVELLGRIFEPFFTTKPVGVGTGLGLSICHNIVSSLGGEITVENQSGQGACFRVALWPAPQESGARPAAPRTAGGRRGRLLVIDDEPSVGAAVGRLLAAEHEVVTVSVAREALACFEQGERFDVILCDLMMPEMPGTELYAAIAALAPDQAERIVFMTGGAFTSRAREFLAHVPNLRVDKPFDSENLRAVIRTVMH